MKTRLRSIIVAASIGFGLAATPQRPMFEVVSVKPVNANRRGMSIETNRGRFVARGATLKFLVQFAYRLQPYQISGGPNWFDSERFEVEARFDGNENANNDDRLILMLQTAIEDRFKLRSHRETKQVSLYKLVIATQGPRLKLSDNETPPSMRGGGGQWIAKHASIANLVSQLKLGLDRHVIDETGLTGTYDFTLVFAPDEYAQPSPGLSRPPVEPNGPSLFTALQEQLGLKLESARGPLEMFVIENVERPSSN
jgi:uncharacterized protein (TIGR03435 family)